MRMGERWMFGGRTRRSAASERTGVARPSPVASTMPVAPTMLAFGRTLVALLLVAAALGVWAFAGSAAAVTEEKKLIYDGAELLDPEDYERLNTLANEYGAKRETDIMIVTSANGENIDVMKMTQDFYDEIGPGYDKLHGNTVILTVDMRNREVYLAGFSKAETVLDDGRLDKIRNKITPHLTDGDYARAFETYIRTAHRYMGFRPGVNPDNVLFNIWFQLGAALAVGGIAVGIMAYRSGGRVTVTGQTYEDRAASDVLDRRDRYVRTTTTRRKIPKNNGGGGGRGGGGGITGGGRSHSGSRGSF